MPRPGTDVTILNTPGAISLPTDTGTAFIEGLTDKGPLSPQLVLSLNDFVAVYGDRQSYSYMYDALDLFFREGGNRAYISRVVGPGATSGTLNLLDSNSAISLVVTAIGPGSWSANYKVGVTDEGSGNYSIQVYDVLNNVLEDSGTLVDEVSAVAWSQFSRYIRIALGVSALNPAPASATALSAGNADRNNVTDAQWAAALTRFTSDLGPGQVLAPGRTTTTAYNQLVAHAESNDRVAILDLPDTATVGTLEGALSSITSRFAAGFAQWLKIPGIALQTTRTVPPSAGIAGLIARNDPVVGPNQPSAGKYGAFAYATDLSQPDFSETDRTALNNSKVNVIRRFKGIRVYGWRSTVDPQADSNWVDFANARYIMGLTARLKEIGENYMFDEIDGQNGTTINGFHDALAGECLKDFNSRQLFGDTAAEGFDVDTSPAVNTLDTIANRELHAIVYVRPGTFAEWIPIQIVKRLINQ